MNQNKKKKVKDSEFVTLLYSAFAELSLIFFIGKLSLPSPLCFFPMKQTWEFQNRWVYYADFIEKKDLIHSFHYIYRVRWSAPTAVRPMARVSANAYFTIKFNKSKPAVSSSFRFVVPLVKIPNGDIPSPGQHPFLRPSPGPHGKTSGFMKTGSDLYLHS